MKKVGSLKQILGHHGSTKSSGQIRGINGETSENPEAGNQVLSQSILGNDQKKSGGGGGGHTLTGITGSIRETLRKKKEKSRGLIPSWNEEVSKSSLPPPMPPVAPTPKLRRVNSSTMSLGRAKKKMLTLDELYVEILYTILHMIGCDAERDEQNSLIFHAKEAFRVNDENHQHLLNVASTREEPYLKANLEIVEARELIGKDSAGRSDPFCTFYLTTNPLLRFNTSYKDKTLDPQWGEDFVLDVNSVDNDCLRIDVWDFNQEENVSEKFKKINEIKDSRGLRKFLKETMNASTGKVVHDLIGSVELALKEVPSAGLDKWLQLEKPEAKLKKKKRGDIHIKVILSTEKDQHLTSQEHKHLLKILFAHELQKNSYQPFEWSGDFSKESVTILAQHAVQGKLSGAETALARWLVFAHTHIDLPLHYKVFQPILEKLKYSMENGLLHAEDENDFVETAIISVHHAVEFLRKHRQYIANDAQMVEQVECILRCLKLIADTIEGRDVDLNSVPTHRASIASFATLPSPPQHPLERSSSSGGVLTEQQRHLIKISTVGNIKSQVEDAVSESIEHWYRYLVETMPMDPSRVMKIRNTTNLVQLLIADLQQGCASGQILFKDLIDVDYSKIAFDVYQKELVSISRELVETTCDKLRPINFSETEDNDFVDETLTTGTSLFELYLSLQQMTNIGKEIHEGNIPATEFMNNHSWFTKAVTRWLDIALYKAMQRIVKAVELDNLEPVDEYVKHSSSAVDIRTVLLQVKTFWKQLSWPDTEASYAFISKILDDICKTSIFYADQMCKKVLAESKRQQQLQQQQQNGGHQHQNGHQRHSHQYVKQPPPRAHKNGHHINRPVSQQSAIAPPPRSNKPQPFGVTPAMCVAINNIDYVLEFIRPFTDTELGMEETLAGLRALNGDMVANSCRRTLNTLVLNAIDNVENKIYEILELIGEKMAPFIQKFLLETSSLVAYAGRDKDTLIQYLDNNMIMLKDKLNEANFDKILSVIWESSALSLKETIDLSIERGKPPIYFETLLDILKVLINFFYGEDRVPQDETLLKMMQLLNLYAADSGDLISRYIDVRYNEQKALSESGELQLGMITVRCQLLREHLRVEVLNARHLKPPDPHTSREYEKYPMNNSSNNPLARRSNQHRRNRRRSSVSNLLINANHPELAHSLEWVKAKFKSLKSNLHEKGLQLHNERNAGLCDPYVSIKLMPESRFNNNNMASGGTKFKTRAQRRTLFPLFDETFDFVLGRGPTDKIKNSYLALTVKDKSILGTGIFLGEAYLPIKELPVDHSESKYLSDMPQIHLPLTRPSDEDSDVFIALESRLDCDRLARSFLDREKKKM